MFDPIFDTKNIRDCDLAAIRRLCLTRIGDVAPAFSIWLHSWLDTEQAARARGTEDRKIKHLLCLPPLAEYDDRALGGALRAVARLTFLPQGEAAGEFLDRIALATAEQAADRLEARRDE